jgi:hypothetical protein
MEPCDGGMMASPVVAWEIVAETLPEEQDTWLYQRERVVYPIFVDPYVYPPEVYVIRGPDGVFVHPGMEAPFKNEAEVLLYFEQELALAHPDDITKAPNKRRRHLRLVRRPPDQAD